MLKEHVESYAMLLVRDGLKKKQDEGTKRRSNGVQEGSTLPAMLLPLWVDDQGLQQQ